MKVDLTGRRALVTGSTNGIGEAAVRLLASCGASVVVHGRDAAKAERVVAEIAAAGGIAAAITGDLAVTSDVEAVIAAIERRLGGVDVLVNNVGDARPFSSDWFAVDDEQWIASYQRNVVAGVMMIRHLVPGMRARRWGRIINIGSGSYSKPTVDFPAYAPAKAALVSMTISLARALTGTGITANVVSPGAVLTATMESNLAAMGRAEGWPETDLRAIEARLIREKWPNAVGRMGRPEEVAAAIAFLASPLSSYITGSNLRIDGGEACTFH
jgi:3-oxoacyl-[acyl-carrier protein] reductase